MSTEQLVAVEYTLKHFDGMSCNPTAATSLGVDLEPILIIDLEFQSIKGGYM